MQLTEQGPPPQFYSDKQDSVLKKCMIDFVTMVPHNQNILNEPTMYLLVTIKCYKAKFNVQNQCDQIMKRSLTNHLFCDFRLLLLPDI